MKRALLGWELGGGRGHVARLLTIARALEAIGFAPVLAVREAHEAGDLLEESAYPILLSPSPPPDDRPRRASSYADVLASRSFADPTRLAAHLRAWDGALRLVEPRLVVADHAPTLCLAARGRAPTIVVGTGFTVPPADGDRFPKLPTATTGSPDDAEREALSAANEALTRLGREGLPRLTALFDGAALLPCVPPELDPYAAHRATPALGPLVVPEAPSPEPPAPSAFAYLGGAIADRFDIVRAELEGLPFPVTAYVGRRGAAAATSGALRVVDRPVDPTEALSSAVAVLHAGGMGMTLQTLTAGRPQLVMPTHLEQALTGARLEELGVGIALSPRDLRGSLGRALTHLVGEPSYAERSRALGAQIRRRSALGALLAEAQRHLDSG